MLTPRRSRTGNSNLPVPAAEIFGGTTQMDGIGCRLDNMFAERLWKNMEYMKVYLYAYDTLSASRHGLERYLVSHN